MLCVGSSCLLDPVPFVRIVRLHIRLRTLKAVFDRSCLALRLLCAVREDGMMDLALQIVEEGVMNISSMGGPLAESPPSETSKTIRTPATRALVHITTIGPKQSNDE